LLDLKAAQSLFNLLALRFEENAAQLDQLDSVIGDGDHGASMKRLFRSAQIALQTDFSSLGELFDCAAIQIAENTGGAIGPLLSAFVAAGGLAFSGKATANLREIADFLISGHEAVQKVGNASPGQKTLLDALAPAVKAFDREVKLGHDPESVFRQAALAAHEGARSTQFMLARQGRARFLAERSLGYQDPGAASIAILFTTLHELVESGDQGIAWQPSSITPVAAALKPVPGKFINDPEKAILEELEGFALAHPHHIRLTDTPGVLQRRLPKETGKVGLAIGHGGGHTPSMAGFVGQGLLDADACGPLFTCASGIRIARAIELANRGAGVILLVSNHTGDVYNARLAVQRAGALGIPVRSILLGDDIATAPRRHLTERRGLGGLLFALKAGGAAAEAGMNLEQVADLMDRANERTATLAVAVRPPTHPATGQPMFEIGSGQLEVGIGVHGEAGVYRGPHLAADAIINILVEKLLSDLRPVMDQDRLWVFVNGSGGTSLMELHILFRRAALNLSSQGIQVAGSVVGSFFTTQDMGGFSLSLGALDGELEHWWNEPASSPCFCWP
jgi:dihydroxyacetone kinase-like protein